MTHLLFLMRDLGYTHLYITFLLDFSEILSSKIEQISQKLTPNEPRHDKTNKGSERPAKTQISLGIRPVWSESSLSAWRNLGSLTTHWAHSEDPDQTGRIPRLIWVFAGHTVTFLVLSCRGSNNSWIFSTPYEETCGIFQQSGSFETPSWLSQDSKELISQMLQVDPKRRITVDGLVNHPWLMKGVEVPVEWHSKYKVNEPCHEIMVLFVLRKLILRMCMCSHPVRLYV